jgi:hypothetical protein
MIMGRFSEMNLEINEKGREYGYAYGGEELVWRYEDLKARYEELLDTGAPLHSDDYFSASDYRYAPEKSFNALMDVQRAMDTVADELEAKHGIAIRENAAVFCDDSGYEGVFGQISFFDSAVIPVRRSVAVSVA